MQADNAFLKRNCPSCGANQPKPSMASKPTAESLTFEQTKPYWSGFFKEKIFFSYQRCPCDLLYCPTYFTEAQLAHLYANMADNTAGVAIEPLVKTQNGYFEFLANYSKLTGNYLEFGPDIGLFTDSCLHKGAFDSYWLFEPNKEVWSALQSKLASKPNHLFADLEGINAIPDNSISTVVMIHVLDHLIDPLKTLQAIKQKLAPGAILLFVTHDESSLLAKLTKAKWPPYCLQHPHLFNPSSIKSLLNNAGLKMLACKKTRNYFPVSYLIKHVLYLLGIKNSKLPEFNKLQVGLKLGNIVTIAINE